MSYAKDAGSLSSNHTAPGEKIMEPGSTGFGTLGPIIAFRDDIYGLTAGHVLEDHPGKIFTIENRATRAVVKANHVVIQHPDSRNDLAKEVGLLRIHAEDRLRVCATIPRVPVNRFFNGEKKYLNLEDGVLRRASIMRYSKTHPSGMTVFKEGQKTGFTVGKLAHYMDYMQGA
jgi:hypothetical protein